MDSRIKGLFCRVLLLGVCVIDGWRWASLAVPQGVVGSSILLYDAGDTFDLIVRPHGCSGDASGHWRLRRPWTGPAGLFPSAGGHHSAVHHPSRWGPSWHLIPLMAPPATRHINLGAALQWRVVPRWRHFLRQSLSPPAAPPLPKDPWPVNPSMTDGIRRYSTAVHEGGSF